jgi:hypothetical protein
MIILGPNANDLTGQRFTRLVATQPISKDRNYIRWECQCDCGKVVEVRSSHLVSGQTKSCGCYARDIQSARLKATPIAWKGGRAVSVKGYVMLRTEPYKQRSEQRVVMELFLGRSLSETELVHHKDGNKHNNDIGNLELTNREDHARHHKNIPRSKKISLIQARRIAEYSSVGIANKDLAETFCVSPSTISDIKVGRTWPEASQPRTI